MSFLSWWLVILFSPPERQSIKGQIRNISLTKPQASNRVWTSVPVVSKYWTLVKSSVRKMSFERWFFSTSRLFSLSELHFCCTPVLYCVHPFFTKEWWCKVKPCPVWPVQPFTSLKRRNILQNVWFMLLVWAEVAFGGKGEDWPIGKLRQDLECASGQSLCVFTPCLSAAILSRGLSSSLASEAKALCQLFPWMILATVLLQSWSHSVVLLP